MPNAESTEVPTERVARPSSAAEFVIRRVRDLASLEEHAAAWEGLAQAALEPNPFYERWMLLPTLRAVGGTLEREFVLVFRHDRSNAKADPLLCGFFPLERHRRYKGLPVKTLRLCQQIFCPLSTPLLRADYAPQTLDAFFDWLASRDSNCALLELPMLPVGSPFHQLLVDALFTRHCLSSTTRQYTRALYRNTREATQYLALVLSGKRRRDLHRRQKLLAELGLLEYVELQDASGLSTWVDEFLRLEASGWKGYAGTALTAADSQRQFFELMVEEAFQRNRLLFSALRLNGRMIAGRVTVRAGSGSYFFKTAYDESYAKYAPGMVLGLEIIQHSDADLAEWTDYCEAPDETVYRGLVRDRRTIEGRLVAPGRAPGEFILSLLPLLSWVKRKLRHVARAQQARAEQG